MFEVNLSNPFPTGDGKGQKSTSTPHNFLMSAWSWCSKISCIFLKLVLLHWHILDWKNLELYTFLVMKSWVIHFFFHRIWSGCFWIWTNIAMQHADTCIIHKLYLKFHSNSWCSNYAVSMTLLGTERDRTASTPLNFF